MALNAAGLQLGAAGIAAGLGYVSLHTNTPGAAGDQNVIAGGRFAVDLVASGGNIALDAPVEATGLTPLATVAHIGFWSASTGGTYYGSAARSSGDAAVNAAGEYTLTAVTIPGSAS